MLEPTAEPTERETGPVAVLQSLSYIEGSTEWVHIVGVLGNHTDQPVKFVKVVASLFDTDDRFTGSEFTYALVDLILPGATVPFDLLITDVPEFARYELALEFDEADDDDLSVLCFDFEIRDAEGSAGFLGYSINGLIENNCGATVEFVEIMGSVYDADSRLIDVAMTFAKLEELAPGQASPFELSFSNANVEAVASFELNVEAELSDAAALTGDAVPAVVVLQSVMYTDELGTQHIIGTLQNNSENALWFVQVIASTYADDKFIGSGTAYAMTDLMLPGDVVPFEVMFFDSSGFASYDLAVESVPADAADLAETCRDLDIGDFTSNAGFLGYEIKGRVTNSCPTSVEFVKIVGAVYNVKEQLIGVGLTYTDLDELAPGTTSSFDLLLFNVDASQVASFKLIAEAEVKE
jgi:hypothetical protein